MFQIRHFATITAFQAYLGSLVPFPACKKIVLHHTISPTPSDWHGLASMEGLQAYYESLGWTSGPHFFVAEDGIYQLSPPTEPGTHARWCNPYSIGVEMVANANVAPVPAKTYELAALVCREILTWIKLPHATPLTLIPHSECGKPECPGKYVNMDDFRNATNNAHRYTPNSAIMARGYSTQRQASSFLWQAHQVWTKGNTTYTQIECDYITRLYYDYGWALKIDPTILVAQMCHETGNLSTFWAQRPRRNPAGIGVTGETRPTQGHPANMWQKNDATGMWEYGLSFPVWNASVNAHIGRLLAYALPLATENIDQEALIVLALKYRPLPTALRGKAPTLAGLAGTWAVPGTNYPVKLAEYANLITQETA